MRALSESVQATSLQIKQGSCAFQETLVPVPTQLFQGSLLLGSIANTVLGESAMRNANVLIHPLLIGGWCGLVATALNSLPVGSLDGGKMTQVLTQLQGVKGQSYGLIARHSQQDGHWRAQGCAGQLKCTA
jgi:membrane-associated protease RseP (regulator of RpoE activity)